MLLRSLESLSWQETFFSFWPQERFWGPTSHFLNLKLFLFDLKDAFEVLRVAFLTGNFLLIWPQGLHFLIETPKEKSNHVNILMQSIFHSLKENKSVSMCSDVFYIFSYQLDIDFKIGISNYHCVLAFLIPNKLTLFHSSFLEVHWWFFFS